MDSPDQQDETNSSEQDDTSSSENITRLLVRWNEGDKNALERLTALIYPELHRLATNYIRKERPGHTLQPTALVNELYLKIFDQQRTSWRNRAHFLAVAAFLMRRILVDYARAYYTSKRNGNRICVSLTNMKDFGSQPDLDLMALNEALVKLQEVDPDQVRIVEFRFFAGLTIEETAEVMKISHATVEREWGTAKAFLKRELTRNGNNL
ncbi:MAG TPA: sigma-70 family RNA polymerase sigma factor [Pyrinomonadaceae bacterium]|jgi:RNA polymerase sigma factor (TIGR02999 family)|nr:sigma-70 family RNA polymerase sigma factor [Pyrinomonadaceae bacterium]